MGRTEFTSPVKDSVPKVNHEVAVGEDLEFQRKWWAFEKVVWSLFGVILALTLLGLFGRGWLAKTQKQSSDGNLILKFDRIQRTGTPSDVTAIFGPDAIHDGHIRLYLSESVINRLGAQRISPQPQTSTLGNGGITYMFPASGSPASVVISVQPSGPGSFAFRAALPDTNSSVEAKVVVVP
jgi:hypothetical protein